MGTWRGRPRWPDRGPLSGLSPRRRWYVVAMAALMAVVGSAVLVAVVDEFRRPPAPAPDVPGTVVLVPGYGGDTSALAVLALRLRVAGRAAVVVTLPDGGVGDFSGQAAAIDAAVAGALRRGARSVDVVGFSAGGVATWLWLTEGRRAPAARRVVTLGAPLLGTATAAAGSALAPEECPPACRQLVPGSALLTRLAAHGPPAGVAWTSIWSRTDDVVSPPDSARLPGVRDVALQDVCPDAAPTHAALLGDQVVIGLLLHAVDRRPFPSFGVADCAAVRALGSGWPRLAP